MKPVIALVGRPNVGKSTLFNRLTRSRDALVADLPGLTRDRHYGEGRVGNRPFLVIDTGGFEPVAKEGIMFQMALQTKQAVAEADVVVFLVDGRQGMTPHDKTITDFLRKSGRPVLLVVNKAEGMQQIFSNTSKVMVDSKAGSNLLYLPLDKLIAQVAATEGRAASVTPPPPAAVLLPPEPTTDPNRRDGRSRESSRDREGR